MATYEKRIAIAFDDNDDDATRALRVRATSDVNAIVVARDATNETIIDVYALEAMALARAIVVAFARTQSTRDARAFAANAIDAIDEAIDAYERDA